MIDADGGSTDGTAAVADIAGCRFVAMAAPRGERLRSAAALARAPWLLFLAPGVTPDAVWIDEAAHFMQHTEAPERAAVFRPAITAGYRSAMVEALALFAAALTVRARSTQALLIAKRHYEEVRGHRADCADPERDLLRRLGRRRIVMLRCRAVDLATSVVAG